MGIPEIIHYCWFGGKEKPKKVKECIASWKKMLPDYTIMEWNENNFDINFCTYIREAYNAGKYAFVSDVARLYALYNYGGIYLDTDVELLSSPRTLTDGKDLILALESSTRLMSAFIAAEKNRDIIGELLDAYNERTFVNNDGSYNLTPNTAYITELMTERGLIPEKGRQTLSDGTEIYGNDVIGAFNADTSEYEIGPETVAVHHCLASWESASFRISFGIKRFMAKHFKRLYRFMRKMKNHG